MRASHRLFLLFLVARIAFGVTFLASAVARWPVPWYLPTQRRWVVARTVSGVAMDWYGRSLLAMTAGLLAGGLAYAVAGVPSVGRYLQRPRVVVGIAHFGMLMLLNDVAFYTLSLLTRHVSPAPIPGWYCPQ